MKTRLSTLFLGLGLALLLSAPAGAAVILEIEVNDTGLTPQVLSSSDFTLDANGNIVNSTTRPHITIVESGDANSSFDFFSFTTNSAGIITIDIDSAPQNTSFDIEAGLWNAAGVLLAQNDDGGIDAGDGAGLVGGAFNSNFTTGVLPAGTYIVGLSTFSSNFGANFAITNPIAAGNTYTLNISANVPEPMSLSLLGLGLAGLASFRARRKR